MSVKEMSAEAQMAFVLKVLDCFDGFDIDSDRCWWRTDGKYAPFTFFVNCNDTFVWGCADCEDLTPENIDCLRATIDECKTIGDEKNDDGKTVSFWSMAATDLFVARQRKMRPQGAVYKYYPKAMWPLFDACGPARDADLVNPIGTEKRDGYASKAQDTAPDAWQPLPPPPERE